MNRHRGRPAAALVVAYGAAIVVLVAGVTLLILGVSDLIFWAARDLVVGSAWAALAVSLAVLYGTVSHIANQRERGDR